MSTATPPGPAGSGAAGGSVAAADPTLTALLPEPSTRRNVALVAAALLVLVGTWVGAGLVRPSVVPASTAGGVVQGDPGRVITFVTIETRGWPWTVVDGVDDVPGARVTDAWLVEGGDDSYLVPPGQAGSLAALPQRVPPGRTFALAVQWEITGCASLDPWAESRVTLRSALGTTSQETLPLSMSPGNAPALLEDMGLCPAGTAP